jgi:hypothetical protein
MAAQEQPGARGRAQGGQERGAALAVVLLGNASKVFKDREWFKEVAAKWLLVIM